MLATCSSDGTSVLWDLLSGQRLASFIQPSRLGVRVCRFSPDASLLLTGGDDDGVCVWDIASGTLKIAYPNHSGTIFAANFTPDGDYVLTSDSSGDMWLWSLASAKHLVAVEEAHDLGVLSLDFCPVQQQDEESWEGMTGVQNEYRLATGGNDDW